MQTESSLAPKMSRLLKSFFKNDDNDDDDDQGPKGPPSPITAFFRPLLRPGMRPALA